MNIWVHGESLASRTSSTPSRGMLRALLNSRPDLETAVGLDTSSRGTSWAGNYIETLPGHRISVTDLPRGKDIRYAMSFVGIDQYCPVEYEADVYIDFDVNYFGKKAKPLVVTLADLSCLLIPESASLTWHGARVWKHALELAVEHADAIVCVSNATRDDLEERFPSARGRAVTIHNGIADAWRKTPQSSGTEKLLDGQPYWIWWGHVTERKNLRRLLRAYSLLLRSRKGKEWASGAVPDLVLVATLGHDSEDIPRLVRDLELGDGVHWLDPQPLDELVRLVDSSEGLLFPSLHEGFGLPAVEALARGKKVLCSDRGALPEVTGGFAEVCDPQDTRALAAGLERLLEHGQLTEREIRDRREWAAQFTYERAARGYGEVIDQLVSGGTIEQLESSLAVADR